MITRRVIIAVVIVSLFGTCSYDSITLNPAPVVLNSSNHLVDRSPVEMQAFLGLSGINLPVSILQYGARIYTVTYKTTYQNNPILASGLVILPTTTSPVGIVSFQHGTIASYGEAPSVLSSGSEELLLYAALASPGFIAVIPDFIGFGSSADLFHPYYVEEATATPIIDLIRAAKEFAAQQNVSFNGNVFLAGYSQGGYATMATHKALELNPVSGLNLVASFPSSGGYDVKGMQEYFFGLSVYDEPFFIAYAVRAYQLYYHWASTTLTDFFQSPYASTIPGLFNGADDEDQINASLNDTIPRLLTPGVLSGIDTNPTYEYLANAFVQNSLLDWAPSKRMYMYHGDADVTVPYQNSVDTYNKLISNGASPSTLTLTPLRGETHFTGVEPYIEDFVPIMISLK